MILDFVVNPIVLEKHGFDLILGMSWLDRYDGEIQCSKRTVQMTAKTGEKVEYQAASPVGHNQIYQAEGVALEDIRVVCEFPLQIGRASCRGKSVDLGGRRIIKKKKKRARKYGKRATNQTKNENTQTIKP